jgi:hypothetical protein
MRRTLGSRAGILLLACWLGAQPGPAAASDSNSSKSSGGNSGSPAGSGGNANSDSSKSSTDGSRGTGNALEGTGNWLHDAPKNSTQATFDYTTQNTTHGQTGHVLSIVGIVLLVGVATVAAIKGVQSTLAAPAAQSALELDRFLQRYHPLVLHDVLAGDGEVLRGWAHELQLSEAEAEALRERLTAPAAQTQLLDALDAPSGPPAARPFAATFWEALAQSVPQGRLSAITQATLGPDLAAAAGL